MGFSAKANITSNGQISEEEPARDERLFWVTGGFVHDVQVWRVKTQGSGRQAVCHQINPQKLDWNQSFRETQDGCQEDAGSTDGEETLASTAQTEHKDRLTWGGVCVGWVFPFLTRRLLPH